MQQLMQNQKNNNQEPDVDVFRKFQTASNGLIKLCDIASEEEGAIAGSCH